MKEDEYDYNEIEAAEFILENISDELRERISLQEIVTLLKLENDYIENEYQKNEKKKPMVSFDLKILDQEDINDYVLRNALLQNIILGQEDVEEIMYAELDYIEERGGIGDHPIHFN